MSDLIDTAVIGAGLSGVSLARQLYLAGQSVQLFEARDRLGGRIHTIDGFDMGPAWFWPGQPRMAARIQAHGLQIFDQFSEGTLSFEQSDGRVMRDMGFSSMRGSLRLSGGLASLVQAEAATLPSDTLHLSSTVTSITDETSHVRIDYTQSGQDQTLRARRAVLTLPPRVADHHIRFEPNLSNPTQQAMQNIPTWMAGQAKVVAIYESAFWRDAGLSGDAMSHRGPLVEIHDASPAQGGPFALFGFVGVPAAGRTDAEALTQACVEQLANIFGPAALNPRAVHLKDWAFDPNTATPADQAPVHAHPTYDLPSAMRDLWGNRLMFAGTEVAAQFGGYLEGALEAAETAAHRILRSEGRPNNLNRTA
ncbi:MAG: NAD(P)/FAD-dependent oxidoreductase [Paracoccaceae bacterium]